MIKILMLWLKSNLSGELNISNKKFSWDENKTVEKLIKDLKLDFEKQWKSLNIINTSIKLPITISINSKN